MSAEREEMRQGPAEPPAVASWAVFSGGRFSPTWERAIFHFWPPLLRCSQAAASWGQQNSPQPRLFLAGEALPGLSAPRYLYLCRVSLLHPPAPCLPSMLSRS